MSNRNRTKPKREPPKRFAWLFAYHVFDVVKAREIAARKPVLTLTTVNIEPLLEDGAADLDLVPFANTRACGILARVPFGEGRERYVLIDGYEIAKRCLDKGQPFRLRVLSLCESRLCRLAAESLGDWPEPEPI